MLELSVMFVLGMAAGWGAALVYTFLSVGLEQEKQIMMNSPPKLKKARKSRDPNKPVKTRAKKVDAMVQTPMSGPVQGSGAGQMAYNGPAFGPDGAVSRDSSAGAATFAPTFGELEKVGRPVEPMVKVNGETQWPAN